MRRSDTLGRLGGEEFGILLQDTGVDEAMEAAERFRAHLQSSPIAHDPPLRITASFGVAVVDAETESVQHWLAAADQALYEAKRTGRNRCCLAAETHSAAPL